MSFIHLPSGRLAGLFLFFLAIPALAQNSSLVGTVRDPQQAAMPGVGVTLTNQDTGVAQTIKTDTSGEYEFPFVKPGNYSVKAEQSGFKTFQQGSFTLAVDQRLRIDLTMQLGEATAIVTVDAVASGVQTESSSLGQIVTRDKIAEIPLNGRFFLDLALLSAGTVVPSTNGRTFLAVPSGIGISGINASGTREDSTNYVFDGTNISD
jgi:Carboxypeptidase regulatory-like domain